MMTNLKTIALGSLILLATSPGVARAQLRVVTTTEDLASLAREVGGDRGCNRHRRINRRKPVRLDAGVQ